MATSFIDEQDFLDSPLLRHLGRPSSSSPKLPHPVSETTTILLTRGNPRLQTIVVGNFRSRALVLCGD